MTVGDVGENGTPVQEYVTPADVLEAVAVHVGTAHVAGVTATARLGGVKSPDTVAVAVEVQPDPVAVTVTV